MGAQNFCYPGIIENFSLACGASHPIFTPAARCAAVLFVAFCWLCASDTPQIIPLRWLAALRYPIFPQAKRDGVFSWRFAFHFFPGRCAVVFFVMIRAPDTPRFTPLPSLRRLAPLPGRPWFFSGRCAAVFFPKAKCSVLPWYLTSVQPHPPHAYGMALFCRILG